MTAQFARNPADVLQCFADTLEGVRRRPDITEDLLVGLQCVAHEEAVFFVTDPIARDIAVLAASYPLTHVEDPFSPSLPNGFVVFQRPILYGEIEGQRVPLSGLLWGVGRMAALVWQGQTILDVDASDDAQVGYQRWIHSLCALVQQKIAALESVPVGRHVRARIAKYGTDAPACRVVALRARERRESQEDHAVEWGCRWLVRPHFRRVDGRLVAVMGYLKGPEDKPLKAPTPRVFAVAR